MASQHSPNSSMRHPLLVQAAIEETRKGGLISGKSDEDIEEEMALFLGPRPMRFGPAKQERSVRAQLLSTDMEAIASYGNLLARWEVEQKNAIGKFTDQQMIRTLRFTKWEEGKAYSILRKCNSDHFYLTALEMEEQLKTATIFPVPGLKTIKGSKVIYFKPDRYFPKERSTDYIIDNLVYVLENLMMQDLDYTEGIAMVCNLSGFGMVNFSRGYWNRFFQVVQGRVFPGRVNLLLFVNAPSWFDRIWSMTKGMLHGNFRSQVFRVKSTSELNMFFPDGYEQFLPDELENGAVSTKQLVQDYMLFQKYMEMSTGKTNAPRSDRKQEETKERGRFRSWSRGRNHSKSREKYTSASRDQRRLQRTISRDPRKHAEHSKEEDDQPSAPYRRSYEKSSDGRTRSPPRTSPASQRDKRLVSHRSIPTHGRSREPPSPTPQRSQSHQPTIAQYSPAPSPSSRGSVRSQLRSFLSPSPKPPIGRRLSGDLSMSASTSRGFLRLKKKSGASVNSEGGDAPTIGDDGTHKSSNTIILPVPPLTDFFEKQRSPKSKKKA